MPENSACWTSGIHTCTNAIDLCVNDPQIECDPDTSSSLSKETSPPRCGIQHVQTESHKGRLQTTLKAPFTQTRKQISAQVCMQTLWCCLQAVRILPWPVWTGPIHTTSFCVVRVALLNADWQIPVILAAFANGRLAFSDWEDLSSILDSAQIGKKHFGQPPFH